MENKYDCDAYDSGYCYRLGRPLTDEEDDMCEHCCVNWCEEYKDYYGNSDSNYGGTLTDLRKLSVGTKFFVANGWWAGEILSDNRMLVHAPTDDFIVELTDKYHSLYLREISRIL